MFLPHLGFSQSVEGTIIDSTTKENIPFALINLIDIDASALADEHGHFRFQGQLPQPIKIRCSAIGYETKIFVLEQITGKLTLMLSPAHIELKEVNISVSTGLIQKNSITNVESKTLEELGEVISPNLSEALSNISGVYNNSTGNGIGKPVIRGLSGNRVLTYLNGLRIENQQFGGDHGLGITELGIAQVDVIKGPSSLLYGADALGGVIHFTDEKYTTKGNFESSLSSIYESNTNSSKNIFSIKTAKNAWRINAYAYFNSSADYRLPSGDYLVNSRFQESAGKMALGYNKKNWVLNIRYSFQLSLIGLPGHSHDSIMDKSSFLQKKAERESQLPVQKTNSHFVLIENIFFLKNNNEIHLFTGFTANQLKEFEEKVTIPGINNQLNTYSYNLRWKKNMGKNGKLISGFQGMSQRNHNHSGAEEILIPQANLVDNGVYTLYRYTYKKAEIQGGLRYDTRFLQQLKTFKETLPQNFFFSGLNYSLGFLNNWRSLVLRTNISSGYRPPHLNELLANGVHHGALRFEIGNIALQPEYATQFDASLEYEGEHLALIFNPFYSQINRYIYLSPTNTFIDNYPVYQYNQIDKARLWGGDFGFHFHPHFLHHLHMESSLSFIQVEDESGHPLPLIPQTRINNTLRLELSGKKFVSIENISLQYLYFLPQNRVAENEISSPEYHLVHFGTQVKLNFKQPLLIKLGIRNLLNEEYIDHLSRLKNINIEAPGRNFYVGIKWNFIKSKSIH